MPKYLNRAVTPPAPEPNGYVKLLEFDVVAGSSAIDVPIPQDGLYDEYVIKINELTLPTGQTNDVLGLLMDFGAGFLITGYNYSRLLDFDSGSASLSLNSSTSSNGLFFARAYPDGFDATIQLTKPSATNTYKRIHSQSVSSRTTTPLVQNSISVGHHNVEKGPLLAVRFYNPSARDFQSGTIRLYGLTK